MHEAVLLLDAVPVRNMDFGTSSLDQRQRGADQRHRVLQRKAGADAVGKLRVAGAGHGRLVEVQVV